MFQGIIRNEEFEPLKKFFENKITPLTKELDNKERSQLRDRIRYSKSLEELEKNLDALNEQYGLKIDNLKILEAFKQKQRKDNRNKEENVIYTSFVEDNGKIYEQIQNYCYIDSEGVSYEEIEAEGVTYKPIQGEEIKREVVLLPEAIEDYDSMSSLIEEVKVFIRKYYDCNEQYLTFSAWYVLLTWVYDRLNTINYLRGLGDFGTGKSRFLDTVGRICYKPIIGSGAGSMAALKRMVEKWRGTALTDEGDFKDDDERNALVKFYNLGFEKNRHIYQCDKTDPNKIDFFNPYCPKIILTRKAFKDQALESRCLTHITKVTKREDIPILLPNEFFKRQMVLRNKLLKFRLDYYYKIDVDKVLEVDMGNIEPRLKQATISFASLFANIPDVLNEFKLFLIDYQAELIEERATSFDGQIVNALFELVEQGEMYIIAKKIIEHIQSKDRNFQATSQTIGRHLKTLGLYTKNRKLKGQQGRWIRFDENMEDLFRKYVIDENKVNELIKSQSYLEQKETTETFETTVTKTAERNNKKEEPGLQERELDSVTAVSNVSSVSLKGTCRTCGGETGDKFVTLCDGCSKELNQAEEVK